MDSTGFCLPSNWSIEEWPDVIAVTHDGTCESLRVYVPERTTTRHDRFKTKYGQKVPLCKWCDYSIGDKRYNFCPNCGAKVVE